MSEIVNKNGPGVKIPIHWFVLEMIKKYNGLPKSISLLKLNVNIIEVAEVAEINEQMISVKTLGGKRTQIVKQIWEMVTCHTARISPATNLYFSNAPLRDIMFITGQKTESQCLK